MSRYEGPIYSNINPLFEYYNMSYHNLGIDGINNVLLKLSNDYIVKHINLSYNITSEIVSNPNQMILLLSTINHILQSNKTIFAIDLAGNHLFENSCHPMNNHQIDYAIELTDIFLQSTITHIDLSDNCILGKSRKMLKGLSHLMKIYYNQKGKALTCRFSSLHSLGARAIASGLGTLSTLTYLDISDNFTGLDPYGNPNSEGIAALSTQLSQSYGMKVLKIARNHLHDEDIVLLCEAIHKLHTLQLIDFSGNYCLGNGSAALKEAIVSHSTLADIRTGLREINISHNPIGYPGVKHLAEAIGRTDTVFTIYLNNCLIDDKGMKLLQLALAENNSVVNLDLSNNPASIESVTIAMAESDAMKLIVDLRKDATSVDTGRLSPLVYKALAKKLRFLSEGVLTLLHHNESFVVPMSLMRESLHLLLPPGRRTLFETIKESNDGLKRRLELSKEIERKISATYCIVRLAMRWKKRYEIKKRIERVWQNNLNNIKSDLDMLL